MASATDQRKALRSWIDGIQARHRVGIPEIARRAKGMSPSTIYRWLDESYPFNPSLTKLREIARAFDVTLPEIEGIEQPTGFAEGDLEALDPRESFDELPVGPNHGRWRITSRALELAGYLPGDIVRVDLTLKPKAGDVVCAQVYDMQGGAQTKLRVFKPPYLVTQSMDPAFNDPPLYVDEVRVVIMGTVDRALRVRAA